MSPSFSFTKHAPLTFFLALLACIADNVHAKDLLIEGVTVVSPEQPQPLIDQYVYIRDERIASLGSRPPKLDRSVQRINGKGRFLTPGLMDSHVHVSFTAGMERVADASLAPLQEIYMRQQPRSYLYFGVTQLLDLDGTAEGVAAFNAQPRHPDLFRCIQAPVLDGYPAVIVPPPDRYRNSPNYIVEPANSEVLPAGADAKAHTPEAVVAAIAATGAKCIKIFIQDEFSGASHWPMLRPATIDRVRDAAHKHGLLVVAHANALDTQRVAVVAQVDVLAHGLWKWTGVNDGTIPTEIAEHLRAVHQQGIGWQPTLRVMAGLRELFVPGSIGDPVFKKIVPAELMAWYRTDAAQTFKLDVKKDAAQASDALIARQMGVLSDRGARATKYLFDLGHPLLLATDTPSSPTYTGQPGYETYREMQLFAQAGIPLRAILEAATLNNAKQFGLDRDYGTVQVGKFANLLLLDANPLDSVNAWNEINKVILRGNPVDRESLVVENRK